MLWTTLLPRPPPFQMTDGPLVLSWCWASRLPAACIQSTLQFYRPVEPKITRLLNSRLPSVWLHPPLLESKSFLTSLQKQAVRVRSVNPLFYLQIITYFESTSEEAEWSLPMPGAIYRRILLRLKGDDGYWLKFLKNVLLLLQEKLHMTLGRVFKEKKKCTNLNEQKMKRESQEGILKGSKYPRDSAAVSYSR